jgi:hypothetical protein
MDPRKVDARAVRELIASVDTVPRAEYDRVVRERDGFQLLLEQETEAGALYMASDRTARSEYDRVCAERDELRLELSAIGAPVVSKEMYDRVCAERDAANGRADDTHETLRGERSEVERLRVELAEARLGCHACAENSHAAERARAERDKARAELAIWRKAAEEHLAELDTLRGEKDRLLSLVQASGDPDPLATSWQCRFEDAQRGERCAHVTCRPLP